jgi:AraC-like DNA-binding protein
MSDQQPTFAELLYECARTKGMIKPSGEVHQTRLSEFFNVNQQTIQRWLKDSNIPQDWRWPDIAKGLNITPHQLNRAIKATMGADLRYQDDETLSALSARVEALELAEDHREAQFAVLMKKFEGQLDQ